MKNSSDPTLGFIFLFVYLLFIVFYIFVNWKIFVKAGKPGWAVIVPIYNVVVLFQIIQRPVWWIFLCFIPFVNLIIAVVMAIDLAKAFGKSEVFGIVGLFLFPIVGYPMLAFGSSKYVGSGSTPAQTPPTAPPQTPPPPAAPAA